MAPTQDLLLKQICGKTETLTKARVFMRTAKAKTGPGSGHELGDGASGLSAICAYIASQELGNGDVSEKVAQQASCLAPKIFANTLNIVRSVLSQSSSDKQSKSVTYEALVSEHKILRASTVIPWMDEAEKMLLHGGQFRLSKKTDLIIVKCAVFYWTAQQLKLDRIKPEHLMVPNDIQPEDFDDLLKIINDECSSVALTIAEEVARLQAAARKAKPSPKARQQKTPGDPSKKSPSKSALKSIPLSVHQKESASSQKRRVAFLQAGDFGDDDTDLPETPTKKRRVAVTRYSSQQLVSSNKTIITASSSNLMLQHLSISDDHPEESEQMASTKPVYSIASASPAAGPSTPRTPRTSRLPSQRLVRSAVQVADDVSASSQEEASSRTRRFRPVFLDRQQWFQRNPKVEKEWKTAEMYKQRMVEAYGHPFEQYRPRDVSEGIIAT